jgi:hypothetical protein
VGFSADGAAAQLAKARNQVQVDPAIKLRQARDQTATLVFLCALNSSRVPAGEQQASQSVN